METIPSPFDLNHAILQWRESLGASPAFRRENLDELEMHLRDSVAVLQARDLSEEEAYFVAAKRAGSQPALGTEFGKVNARNLWLDHAFWMLVGNLLFWIVSTLLSFVGSGLLFFGFQTFAATSGNSSDYLCIALFTAVTQLVMFAGTLAICWHYLFTQHRGRMTAWLAKNAHSSTRLAGVAAIVLGVMLSTRILQLASSALLFRYAAPSNIVQVAQGQSYGNLTASLIESATLVVLTLWLARRRLLAKA